MKRYAFTMIELIFVIVVLGILAAVALPKMGSVMDSSHVASAQGDVSGIRASIASARQKQLVRGKNKYISKLSTKGVGGSPLFDGNSTLTLLTYPIQAKEKGGWYKTAAFTYTYSLDGTAGKTATFTYNPNDGTFKCDYDNEPLCKKIVN